MDTIDSLWDYARPAETEAKFHALASTLEGEAARLELRTQIARAQGLQRRFDDAHATLDGVERELERLRGVTPRPRLRYLLERGRVWNTSGDPRRARAFFVEAWDAARDAGEDALAVDAAHMIAIVSPADEGLAWNRMALEQAEHSSQPGARRWRASLLNNLGWNHVARGERAEALACFERAAAARAEMGDPRQHRIARWAVARTLRLLGRLDEALAAQRELAGELERAGERDGFVDEELGECLLALGQAAAAAPHFERAYAELSRDPGLTNAEPERLSRIARLSKS